MPLLVKSRLTHHKGVLSLSRKLICTARSRFFKESWVCYATAHKQNSVAQPCPTISSNEPGWRVCILKWLDSTPRRLG